MKRVPELIDVWFDSGSMPYAQWHHPFENDKEFKEQFPADYICEAVDQTRGWFYSLHAISTLLYDSECFKNVICLGLVLDGQGQKMSKTKGNVISTWDVLNKNGADAMRWYLYTASPPGQERRFSSDLVGEVLRNFTLTLWNTYSFFVTYANLDGWKPEKNQKIEYSSLDKWLLSSLHTLVRDVSHALETYDVIGATRPIEQFVDQLSNWYLRRSRRRFWKSGSDTDKQSAYATLYEALVTVSKLLAPTMPFIADEIYLNLVGSVEGEAVESVHLEIWPQYDQNLIDEKLNRDMRLTSLGHAARNKANKKVRQPLSEVAFAVANRDEISVLEEYAELLEDELNVKTGRSLNSASEAVSYSLNPLPKQLGQKYGSRYPQIRQAVLALDAEKTSLTLLAGENITVRVGGETLDLLPEEVEVSIQAKEGYAVGSEGAYLAALVTELTPELIQEGLAREFVRRIQDLRKTADLEIADRIKIVYTATPGLLAAVQKFSDYIKTETLCLELVIGEVPEKMVKVQDEFDQEKVEAGIAKV
jgi:isoleucyl-tRNA synthetase